MKIFYSLCKMLIMAFYGITRISFKKSAKEIAKTLGIGFLILYGVVSVGFIFVAVNLQSYESLKPAGLQEMMIINNLLMISVITFVFSLITALSVYFLSEAELSFQALPLKPWQLFASKITVVYVSEALLSLLIILPMLVIFGVKEHSGLLFYIYGILGALMLPIIPICIVFTLIVPVVRAFKFMRRRSLLLVIAGFLGVGAMVAFQVFYQTNTIQMSNPEWLAVNYTGPDSLLSKVSSAYLPGYLLWKAMANPASFGGILHLIGFFGLSLAVFALIIVLLSKAYSASLVGFNEQSLRKLSNADEYIQKNFHQKKITSTLFFREVNLMNREPVYVFNGLSMIFLLPIILIIMYFAQKPLIEKLFAGRTLSEVIMPYKNTPITVLIAAAAGAFMGSSTMISATAFSRDAKFLLVIKSLPIVPGQYGLAKLVHALLFGLIAILVGTIPVVVILQFSFPWTVLAIGLALGFVWFANIASLYLDTAFPRLKWDTPTAAFKNNPNAIASVFGIMGFLALIGLAAHFLKISTTGYALLIFIPMFLVASLLTWKYPLFVRKRLKGIEP